MKYILATKDKMTQIFDEVGNVIPATLVNTGPMTATQVKTKESDGYNAVRFGFIPTKKMKTKPFKFQKELRARKQEEKTAELNFKKDDIVDASIFSEGDVVTVSGVSKGKGFQGVVKRHGFGGGRRTHGQKHSEREAGAIGGGGRAGGRVSLGVKMAGRMGGDRITVQSLKVLKVDKEKNQMLISGAVPGRRGTLLEIKSIK